MASRKRGKLRDEESAAEDVAPSDDPSTIIAPDFPSKTPVLAEREDTKKVVVPIDSSPPIICKRFVVGGGRLHQAFLFQENLARGKKLPRKLTRTEWKEEFGAWKSRPR